MVNIEKIDNKNIKVDGVKVNIDEYNKIHCENGIAVGSSIKKASYGNISGLDDKFFADIKWCLDNYGWLAGSLYGRMENGKFIEMKENEEGGQWMTDSMQVEEILKNRGISPNVYADIQQKEKTESKPNGNTLWAISPGKVENWSVADQKNIKETIERNNKIWNDNLTLWKEIIALKKQLKVQRDDTGQNPGERYVPPQEPDNRDERNQKWERITGLRKSVAEEIKTALSASPSVSSPELDKPNWNSLLDYARSETEIENLKNEVLTDISQKRAAKTGNNDKKENSNDIAIIRRDAIHDIDVKRNEAKLSENDLDENNQNYRDQIMGSNDADIISAIKNKVLSDIHSKMSQKSADKVLDKIKNSEVSGLSEEELKNIVKIATQLEGEKQFKDSKIVDAEAELFKKNPQAYKDMIIGALRERLKDHDLHESELDNDFRKLLNNEVNDFNEIKAIKNKALKKSGEKIAESKWSKLIRLAKEKLAEAKRLGGEVGEELKKSLTQIQKDIKKMKGASNDYLQSFYQKNNKDIEQLLVNLEENSTNEQQIDSPSKTPWGVIIPLIGISILTISGIIIIIRNRRIKKKQAKNK
ncbi:MAG: hypothetical protein I3273_07730 [Candidatus Moeniiplasma glomeromycotorum]|nr:hypothetical protein [Candidatus Moeniiplasma glomeromycotorum]MCE8168463.1 hypothetical protein [Candidatus Moeniiplasma glomeromycotorum]MCE8169970.1 hypothetical protein [Candidatus Moeniiplasma glomeromycotorum]